MASLLFCPLLTLLVILLCSVTSSMASGHVHDEPLCELPSFVRILPITVRRQLRTIWAGVRTTGDCSKQLAATRDLISSLPTSLKLKITEYETVEKSRFQISFYTELLPEEKVELANVLRNDTLTAIEKTDMLRRWGRERLSPAAFDNFEEYLSMFLERDKRLQSKLESLSPEAKEAYERLQEIKREKQQILARLSDRARKELIALYRHRCIVHPPHSVTTTAPRPASSSSDEQPESESSEINCRVIASAFDEEEEEAKPVIVMSRTQARPDLSEDTTGSRLLNIIMNRIRNNYVPQLFDD